eukprot:g3691.t1
MMKVNTSVAPSIDEGMETEKGFQIVKEKKESHEIEKHVGFGGKKKNNQTPVLLRKSSKLFTHRLMTKSEIREEKSRQRDFEQYMKIKRLSSLGAVIFSLISLVVSMWWGQLFYEIRGLDADPVYVLHDRRVSPKYGCTTGMPVLENKATGLLAINWTCTEPATSPYYDTIQALRTVVTISSSLTVLFVIHFYIMDWKCTQIVDPIASQSELWWQLDRILFCFFESVILFIHIPPGTDGSWKWNQAVHGWSPVDPGTGNYMNDIPIWNHDLTISLQLLKLFLVFRCMTEYSYAGCAYIVYLAERSSGTGDGYGIPQSLEMTSYSNCVYLILVTILTVGYGDHFPVTVGGRIGSIIAVFVQTILTGVIVYVVSQLLQLTHRETKFIYFMENEEYRRNARIYATLTIQRFYRWFQSGCKLKTHRHRKFLAALIKWKAVRKSKRAKGVDLTQLQFSMVDQIKTTVNEVRTETDVSTIIAFVL